MDVDLAALRERDDVDYLAESTTDEGGTFEYFSEIEGLVAVGIVNDAGAVLLMESAHGWRLPYGPVENGEDALAVAGRIAASLTGRESRGESIERVTEFSREHATTGETTTSYDVVIRVTPVSGEPVAANPDFGPWEDLVVEWFEEVPEDAYHEHGSAVSDIERFV